MINTLEERRTDFAHLLYTIHRPSEYAKYLTWTYINAINIPWPSEFSKLSNLSTTVTLGKYIYEPTTKHTKPWRVYTVTLGDQHGFKFSTTTTTTTTAVSTPATTPTFQHASRTFAGKSTISNYWRRTRGALSFNGSCSSCSTFKYSFCTSCVHGANAKQYDGDDDQLGSTTK